MSKIELTTGAWVPTIMKVENGFIISCKTPNPELNVIEVYVYGKWEEVVDFLADNFGEIVKE